MKSQTLPLTLGMLALILACNMPFSQPNQPDMPSVSPDSPTNPPVGTSTNTPFPSQEDLDDVLTFGGAATSTPLPPMPDFKEALSFGGTGEAEWGCPNDQYPSVPNTINVMGNYEKNVFLCIFVRGIDPAKPMKVSLSQIGGDSITLVSTNAMFDRNGEAILWEESLHKGVVNKWTADGSVFFTLVIWWPVTLPSGSWRITVYQEGGFRVSKDVPILKVRGKAYLDVLDPNARLGVLPASHWMGDHLLHLNGKGNVDVYGTDYPPNTPVYLILYRSNRLVQKTVMISDGSGSISTELPGPFDMDQYYQLYGITDPNTTLDGSAFIDCSSALASVAGAACDYFNITPAIVRSSCPGAPLQRMIVNERGRVCTQSDSVRLRSAPARSASTLMQLEPETYFKVIGGPACSDNWSWWNIQLSDGTIGWVSEGGDEMDQYFICPN